MTTEQQRIDNLLDLSDRISVMAKQFQYLANTVGQHEVSEEYFVIVEACGKQVSETLKHVSGMVDMIDRMSKRPTAERMRVQTPRVLGVATY